MSKFYNGYTFNWKRSLYWGRVSLLSLTEQKEKGICVCVLPFFSRWTTSATPSYHFERQILQMLALVVVTRDQLTVINDTVNTQTATNKRYIIWLFYLTARILTASFISIPRRDFSFFWTNFRILISIVLSFIGFVLDNSSLSSGLVII